MRNEYKISARKPEGMRPFESPKHRWKDEIEMDLTEMRYECVD
jgi:hypothetical protein